jgi:hypothetical protein
VNPTLNYAVDDENFSWNKSLGLSKEKYLISIKPSIINLILENRGLLETEDLKKFEFLKDVILEFKKKLISGCGFLIVDGNDFNAFSKKELKLIYSIITQFLGKLYVQNIKNEKFVVIRDEGKSMMSGGRYHQTKEGGSFHTDSPQWKKVPDFIGMCCINPAKKGGESKFVSAYSIHNKMLKDHKHFLEMLYEQFYFDKRGEYESGESPTVFEPIFTYNDNQLKFRYLRDYINDGHKIQNMPLSKEQNEMLDCFDRVIHDENLAVSYELKQNDMVFLNNNRVVHGRTSFEDFEDIEKKRLMIRTWIKDESDNNYIMQ